MALAGRADATPAVDRPRAQRFPDATDADADADSAGAGSTDAEGDSADAGARSSTAAAGGGRSTDASLPDVTRPGYGPDSPRPEPVEPAASLGEWFHRQTYVSLSLKVGFVATLCSAFVFSSLAVGLSVIGA